MYAREAEEGKKWDTCAGLRKIKELVKHMILGSERILHDNTHCARAMLFEIRKMILVLLRQEMESMNGHKDRLTRWCETTTF